MAQSQSECRMGAIFLESLFLEQIGAVVDRTISRPLPHRCFAIFSQYSYYNTSNNIKNSRGLIRGVRKSKEMVSYNKMLRDEREVNNWGLMGRSSPVDLKQLLF